MPHDTTYKNILEPQLPLSWILTTPKLIADLSTEYDFGVSDIDGQYGYSIADFKHIKISDYTTVSNPYPKIITLEDTRYYGTTTIVLDLTWE